MSGLMSRRLSRELRKIQPGDEVTLRVYADGRYKTVRLQTAEAPAAARRRAAVAAEEKEEAATPRESASNRESSSARGTVAVRRRATVAGVIEALNDAQTQLLQLLEDESPGRMRDALRQAEQQIAELQQQLRDARPARPETSRPEAGRSEEPRFEVPRPEPARRPSSEDEDSVSTARPPRRPLPAVRNPVTVIAQSEGEGDTLSLNGLRLSLVTPGLASYFGEGSERGVLVVEADSSWSPLRAGDVILRLNGTRVRRNDRIRFELAPRQENTVDIMRRGREMTLTLRERDE
jgi:hypothetical protein